MEIHVKFCKRDRSLKTTSLCSTQAFTPHSLQLLTKKGNIHVKHLCRHHIMLTFHGLQSSYESDNSRISYGYWFQKRNY